MSGRSKEGHGIGKGSGTLTRISLACEPCRYKKVRCEGQKPQCANCVKSGQTDCSYNARSDMRKPYSKAFVSTLQARINSLEKELARYTKPASKDGIASSKSGGGLVPDDSIQSGAATLQNTPEPHTTTRTTLNEGELVGQLAKRGGNLLRQPDTSESQGEGTLRFYGASSSRNFPVAHCSRTFDFSRMAQQARRHLSSAGFPTGIEWSDGAQSLYEAYFRHANPILMLLEEDIFYKNLALGDAATHTTPLLLNAVCAVGAFVSGDKTACERYLERARFLLDVETSTPQLSTIQALVLTGYCEAACGRESRGWAFFGMASRIALELGLPRDSHEYVDMEWLTEEDMRARHRSLWSLFIVDKLLSLYYGRPAALDHTVISVSAPSPGRPPPEALSIVCPRPEGSCSSCHRYDDVTMSMYELTNYSVEIYLRLYANPILKADASSRWTGWASDLNLRLAQWNADLPRSLKCTFTRGQVPDVATMTLHLLYHSLVILLNRPFLPLGAHMSEAAFSAKSCHLACRTIARLLIELETHHTWHRAHNYTVYVVHTALTIALLNSKSSTGTVQREARNDLKSLVASLHRLSSVHLNAVNVHRLVTALLRRSFAEEKEWVDSVCEEDGEQAAGPTVATSTNGTLLRLHSAPPPSHAGPPSAVSVSTAPFAMGIDTLLQHQQPFSDADLSQFALIDWDSYGSLDNVIGGLDIQPWLK